MANKVIKDPFNAPDSAPQITNVYQYQKPPDLRGFDSAKGGKHIKRELTDDGFTSDFDAGRDLVLESIRITDDKLCLRYRRNLFGGSS